MSYAEARACANELGKSANNMDSLIAIGSAASFAYGIYAIYMLAYGFGHHDMAMIEKYHMELYFEGAAMILTLITLGKYLETKSKGKTSEAIEKLMKLGAKEAILFVDNKEVLVPVENVQVGDILVLKPGMSVPVDGIVIQGSSTFDESAITGESMPISKEVARQIQDLGINIVDVKIGDKMVIDPTLDEEKVASARLNVGVTKDGHICSMQKGQGLVIVVFAFSSMTYFRKE